MARHVKNGVNLKGELHKKVTIGVKLFGFVRNINVKLAKLGSVLPVRAETANDYAAKTEMERAKAAYCTHERTSTN